METFQADKLLSVAAIENGTVIDHIDKGKAILISRLLKLEHSGKQITLGLNLQSSRMGIKDIIKVEGVKLTPKDTTQIAIFSPRSTINMIENHSVIKKYTVNLPEMVEKFIVCPNFNCITNHEDIKACFYINADRKEILLSCKYCEKNFYQSELKIHHDYN